MPKSSQLSKYQICKTLGQGSFGKALLVKIKGNKQQYFVMKEIKIGHLNKKEKATSIAEATGALRGWREGGRGWTGQDSGEAR